MIPLAYPSPTEKRWRPANRSAKQTIVAGTKVRSSDVEEHEERTPCFSERPPGATSRLVARATAPAARERMREFGRVADLPHTARVRTHFGCTDRLPSMGRGGEATPAGRMGSSGLAQFPFRGKDEFICGGRRKGGCDRIAYSWTRWAAFCLWGAASLFSRRLRG